MTDAALAMSAFSPGDRQPGRAPDEVAAELSDEDIMKGPLAGIFQGIKVLLNVLLSCCYRKAAAWSHAAMPVCPLYLKACLVSQYIQ